MGLAEDIRNTQRAKAEAKAKSEPPNISAEDILLERATQKSRFMAEFRAEQRSLRIKLRPELDKLEPIFDDIGARRKLIETRDTVWHKGQLDQEPVISTSPQTGINLYLRYPFLRLGSVTEQQRYDQYSRRVIEDSLISLGISLSITSEDDKYLLGIRYGHNDYGYTSEEGSQTFNPGERNGAEVLHTLLVSSLAVLRNPNYIENKARNEIERERKRVLPWYERIFGYGAGDLLGRTWIRPDGYNEG